MTSPGHVVVCFTKAQAEALLYAAGVVFAEWDNPPDGGESAHHPSTIKALRRGRERLEASHQIATKETPQ